MTDLTGRVRDSILTPPYGATNVLRLLSSAKAGSAREQYDGQMPTKGRIYLELTATVGLFAIPSILGSVSHLLAPAPQPSSLDATIAIVTQVVQEVLFLLLATHVLRLNGESWSVVSKLPERKDAWIAIGLTIGAYVVSILALFAWAVAVGSGQAPPAAMSIFQKSTLVPIILLVLVNPFCEEMLLRGFLQHRLTQAGWPPVTTVFFSAALQASYHLYQGVAATVSYFAMFLLFASTYQATRRLWAVVAAHALIDWYGMASLLSAKP